MNLPFFIARRYFLSKRKKNFINVISLLSMVGVAFSTAALIIVLSVFNGLEDLLKSLYVSFDPELKIEATQGKSFAVNDSLLSSIRSVKGVGIVTEVIEDYAYLRYRESDMVAIIKGVSDNFIDQHRLDDRMVAGNLALRQGDVPFAIIGRGVQYQLSIAVDDDMFALQVFYIRNLRGSSLDPSRMYARKSIRPGGVFSIEKNYDENYVFLPLDFVEDLLDYEGRRTALEIKVREGENVEDVQAKVQMLLGTDFQVLTNEQQHRDLYRLLKMEKLFTFLALGMLILIGSINIFFSLMMLAIDKKKDVTILSAMGANRSLISRIFLTEGAVIAGIGAMAGLAIGGTICWMQQTYGLVGMGMENAIVANYPVKMKTIDFLSTGMLLAVVTVLVSFYPASLAAKSYSTEYL